MKNHPIFQALSEEEYKKVLEFFTPKKYEKGDFLAKEGEYSSKAFVLTKGVLSVIKTNNYNESYEVKEIKAPADEFFGEVNLIDRGLVISTIKAKTDCEVLEITHDEFVELLERYPRIFAKILWIVSYDLTRHLRKADDEVKALFNALSEVVDND